MSDFDGKPIVFRDDIERAFWGRCLSSLLGTRSPAGATMDRGDVADLWVVEMRRRQVVLDMTSAGDGRLSFGCAVCRGKDAHADKCPLAKELTLPVRP